MSYTCPVCYVTKDLEDNIDNENTIIFINLSCNHHICEICYVEWHIKKSDPKCVICRQSVVTFDNLRAQKRATLTMYSLYIRILVCFVFVTSILLVICFINQENEIYNILIIVLSVLILFSVTAIDNYMIKNCYIVSD